MGAPHPLGPVAGAEVEHGEVSGSGKRLDQTRQEALACGVDPLQVLEHVQCRSPGALGMDEAPDQGEQAPLAGLGAHRLGGALGVGDTEEVEQQRKLLAS